MKLVLQKLWYLVALCASFQFIQAASVAQSVAQQEPLRYMMEGASSDIIHRFNTYLHEGETENLPLAFGLEKSKFDEADPLDVDAATWGDLAQRSRLVALVFTRSEKGQLFIGLYGADNFNVWMAKTPADTPASDPTMRDNKLRSDGIFYFNLSRHGFHFAFTLDQIIRGNAGQDKNLAKICIREGEVRKAQPLQVNNNMPQDPFVVPVPAVAVPAGDEDFARRLQGEADQAREQQQRDRQRAQEILQGARQRLEAQQREREAERHRQEAEAAVRQAQARWNQQQFNFDDPFQVPYRPYRPAAAAYPDGGGYRPAVQPMAVPPQPPRPSILKYAIIGLAHGLLNKWLSGGAVNKSWIFAPWREWATAWLFGNVRNGCLVNDQRNIHDGPASHIHYWFMSALVYGAGQAFGEIMPPLKLALKPLALSATGPWRNVAVNDPLLQALFSGLVCSVVR